MQELYRLCVQNPACHECFWEVSGEAVVQEWVALYCHSSDQGGSLEVRAVQIRDPELWTGLNIFISGAAVVFAQLHCLTSHSCCSQPLHTVVAACQYRPSMDSGYLSYLHWEGEMCLHWSLVDPLTA